MRLLATFLLLALPPVPSDPEGLLRELARSAASKAEPDKLVRATAMTAIQKHADAKAIDALWEAALKEDALKLPPEQRSALWKERLSWRIPYREQARVTAELEAFAKAFPGDPGPREALQRVMAREARYGDPAFLQALFDRFGKDLPEADRAKYAERLARFKPGGEPPPLAAQDWDGKPFDLSALKGKPVLLYYWASG